jgi:hypothetical protein
MSNWTPARVVDFILRFNADFGPSLRAALEGVAAAALPPEEKCREACRAIARGVGVATHAYVWAAPNMPVTAVRLPVDVDPTEGAMIHLRIALNVPMNTPIDYTQGTQVQGLLQSLMGLPRGSLAGVEITFPGPAEGSAQGPLLSPLNPRTLPGQKLCAYCRNPMPAYETLCQSCGARVEG